MSGNPSRDIKIVEEPPIRFVVPEGPLERKKVLVIGSPKSGTTYMAWFLREMGLRVDHERMGEDGTVNAAWLVAKIENDPLMKEEKGRQHFHFDKVIHLVRHPLFVLASMQALPPWPFLRWQYLWTGIKFQSGSPPPLHALARFWIWWTDRCESTADTTVRLRDISDHGPPINRTSARVKRLQWKDLAKELKDDDLYEELVYRAGGYGLDARG